MQTTQISSVNTFLRNQKIYLDIRSEGKRLRLATGLKNSALALKFVRANYELFLSNKAKAQAKYYELEDKKTMKLLKKDEPKSLNDELFIRLTNEVKNALHLKQSSKKSFTCLFNNIEGFFISKNLKLKGFKKEHINAFYEYFKAKKNSNKHIKMKFIFLSRLLNLALEQGFISENALAKIPKLKADESDLQKTFKELLSYEDVQILLKKAQGELKNYLFIALFTGARTGEILALQKKDIDFVNKSISITKTKYEDGRLDTPKTKSSYRKIDLLPVLENKLLRLCEGLKDEDFLIKENVYKLRSDFKALLKDLNLPELRLYDTRHSFASIMLSKGEEPMWVGCKMLGHKNLNETFKTYAKYLPQEVKQRASFINEGEFDE